MSITTQHPLSSQKIATISLTRLLEMSPEKYRHFISDIESSNAYVHNRTLIHKTTTKQAKSFIFDNNKGFWEEHGGGYFPNQVHNTFSYTVNSPYGNRDNPFAKLMILMNLVNSRNELVCATIEALSKLQRSYLCSLNRYDLELLNLEELSNYIIHNYTIRPHADTSRLSRVTRNITISLGNGGMGHLRQLLFSEEQLHEQQLQLLLEMESRYMANNTIRKPWSDGELSQMLLELRSIQLTRRGVGAIRLRLNIPNSRERNGLYEYWRVSRELGALCPLTSRHFQNLPKLSGVYEIRIPSFLNKLVQNSQKPHERDEKKWPSDIIYIGSSSNIRVRVMSHFRGNSRNHALYQLLATGDAKIRFLTIQTNWRLKEKLLYHAHLQSYGVKPLCNKISP